MTKGIAQHLATALAFAGAILAPISAGRADTLERSFDAVLGSEARAPRQLLEPVQAVQRISLAPSTYTDPLYRMLAGVAAPDRGRIGVAAMDLATGRSVGLLDSQPFPMASTSKIAIVATFLQGVDEGHYRLSDLYPMMVALPSAKFAGAAAPVRAGRMMTAQALIEAALIHSNNQATDGLLAAVGGPVAVNRWLARTGVSGLRLDRDIATLVRDDGAINPATTVDLRDSATPKAMVGLLGALYRGQLLSDSSRQVLFSTMERCVTGRHRLKALLPEGASIAHKTGTLANTSSDVGIIHTADGRNIVLAVYVTGQGSSPARDQRIATIARTLYDGFQADAAGLLRGPYTAASR